MRESRSISLSEDRTPLLVRNVSGGLRDLGLSSWRNLAYKNMPGESGETGFQETYHCLICLERHRFTEGSKLDCGHYFCTSCIRRWLEIQIVSGNVDLRCFHQAEEKKCNHPISDETIRRLVDDGLWAKYQRFKRMQKDQSLRDCPFCGAECSGTAKKSERIITCHNCSKQFCFLHANAHPPSQSCEDYIKQNAKKFKLTEDLLKAENSIPCPYCGRIIQKNGGCNHMTCFCGGHFCWQCKQKLERNEVTEHYLHGDCDQFEPVVCPLWCKVLFYSIFGTIPFIVSLVIWIVILPLLLLLNCCCPDRRDFACTTMGAFWYIFEHILSWELLVFYLVLGIPCMILLCCCLFWCQICTCGRCINLYPEARLDDNVPAGYQENRHFFEDNA